MAIIKQERNPPNIQSLLICCLPSSDSYSMLLLIILKLSELCMGSNGSMGSRCWRSFACAAIMVTNSPATLGCREANLQHMCPTSCTQAPADGNMSSNHMHPYETCFLESFQFFFAGVAAVLCLVFISTEEWNRMVGKYCRTFRESDPALVQDLEEWSSGIRVSGYPLATVDSKTGDLERYRMV